MRFPHQSSSINGSVLMLILNFLYETTPKWHGLLMIKLAAFQASAGARMKHRLAGTMNRLNVEHRTSNVDDATLYRF